MSSRVVGAGAAVLLAVAAGGAADGPAAPPAVRFPVGHAREGLPTTADPVAVYAADPAHPLNELHALLFTRTQVPEEVGAALPAERPGPAAAFFVKGWQFGKRKGTDADRGVFGGDVRVTAVTAVEPARRERLLVRLGGLATAEQVAAVPELRNPVARLLLQWDVLSLWWRLEADRKWATDDAPLLTALARTVRALAQPKATLEGLPAGTAELARQFAGRDRPAGPAVPYLPALPLAGGPAGGWVEVDRKASKLFRGDVALRASRIFLDAGGRERSARLGAAAGEKGGRPDVPAGTEVALVMSLVGFDPDLTPVPTPVVDEVRVRRLSGPFALAADNPTSSKDGVDQWVYLRSRAGSVAGGEAFRFLPDTTQGLFVEYGSAKHTTFAAQCALCHRADINTPTQPRGVSVLNPSSRPRLADDPAGRGRAAVEEMRPVADRLRDRLTPPG